MANIEDATGRSAVSRFFQCRPHTIPAVIAAVMLVGAMGRWPYSYYTLLRWVTCLAAGYVLWQAWSRNCQWALWPLGMIVLLFNPLVPFHLARQVWRIVDVVTGLFLLACVPLLRLPVPQRPAEPTAEQQDDRKEIVR